MKVRFKMNHVVSIMIVGAFSLATQRAHAQAYDIPWHTVDGGGETSSGGGFELSGTIGQPDAGPAMTTMTGGGFELTGGFWAGAGDAPCNLADQAPPFGVLDLADITAFVSAFTGQNPAGDLDGNGLFDLADITIFVNAFTSGCP